MALAALVGLAVNHVAGPMPTIGRLLILCFGPLGLMLGIGGLIEPKIMWAVGKYGKTLPGIYKISGALLVAAGVIITILLVVFVYPLGEF
jgi:hypothetical protein